MRAIVSFAFMISCLWLLSACGGFRPAANLVINNESNTAVPLQIAISKKGSNTPSHTITESIAPGIQQIAAGRFAKGQYEVTASLTNGAVTLTRPVSLDTDRWIIINYISSDSLSIQRKYGYVDTAFVKKTDDRYTGIDIFSENRLLPTLIPFNKKTLLSENR